MGSKSRIAKHIVPIIQKYIDENKNVIEEKELPIHYGYINRRYVNGRAVVDLDKKYIIFVKKEKEKE